MDGNLLPQVIKVTPAAAAAESLYIVAKEDSNGHTHTIYRVRQN